MGRVQVGHVSEIRGWEVVNIDDWEVIYTIHLQTISKKFYNEK